MDDAGGVEPRPPAAGRSGGNRGDGPAAPIAVLGRFLLLVVLMASLAVGVTWIGAPEPADVAALVDDRGVFGPVMVVGASALLLLALVPRSVLAAGGGLVFGATAATGYVVTAAVVAALTAFAVGRVLGRDLVASRSRLARVDAWLTARGGWGVLVLRILPVGPFGLVSYILGTTGVTVRGYLAGTAAGVLPSTVVYANLGASAMRPGSVPFIAAVTAAVVLGVGGAAASAVLRRRRRSREPRALPGPGIVPGSS